MKKVLIPTKLDKVVTNILAATGKYTVVQDDKTPLPELAAKHPDAYALIVRSEKVDAAVIDALPALKVVVRAGAGYDTINTKHARRKGVDVMNTPGANSNAVAEEVIALMLADARQVLAADASCRAGKWDKKAFMGREITGKTIGIVGLGNIGQLVAKRLAGFEMRMLGFDPIVTREQAEKMGVTLTDIETLLAESDYITLHIPENDETRGFLNRERLARVKAGATVINCARAGVVDEAALREAKAERKLRFLNDVYPKDAEGPKSIADTADIMLPHLGASTHEANATAARRAAEELIDFDEKGVTSFIVNREIPEGLDPAYCELANLLGKLCRGMAGEDAALQTIETSFYGTLQPFGEWLLVPVVAGIWPDFDRSLNSREAQTQLAERGVSYQNRQTDPAKRFENSITVDLAGAAPDGRAVRASVRGTVAEATMMVSRINEFDKLYFEPRGPTAFVLYDDRPGVIGTIGLTLADAGINIVDIRNSYDARSNRSLAILKVNRRVPAEVLEKIRAKTKAPSVFELEF